MENKKDDKIIDRVIITTCDGVQNLDDVKSVEQKGDFFVIKHQTIRFCGVVKEVKDNLSYYHNSVIKELQIVFK